MDRLMGKSTVLYNGSAISKGKRNNKTENILFHTPLIRLCAYFMMVTLMYAAPACHAQSSPSSDTINQNKFTSGNFIQLKDTIEPLKNTPPHVYKTNYWFSAGFSLLATAANLYAIPKIIHNKRALTDQELDALNPDVFNDFDRWALRLDPAQRTRFYNISDYVLPGIVVSAATLAFDKKVRKDWAKLLLMYYEMHAATFTIYNFSFFGPAFQNKFRPVVYYDYFSRDERRGGNQRNSLYSGHVASSAASTFFMVKVYTDYHPELAHKKFLLYTLASIPPLVEGYFRVRALAHFPTDCMVGFMIGATMGVLVPEIHRIKHPDITLGLDNTTGVPGIHLGWAFNNKQVKMLNTFKNAKFKM